MLFVVYPQMKVFSPNQTDLHTPKSRHKGCIQSFCLDSELRNISYTKPSPELPPKTKAG